MAFGNLAHDDQIVEIRIESFDQFGSIGDHHRRFHVAVLVHELAEQMRHEVFRGGHHAQAQLALDVTLECTDCAVQLIDARQDVGARRVHFSTGIGEVVAFTDLLE